MSSSVCRVGAGAHYPGWLYGLCAEKPPGAVLLLGGIYAVWVDCWDCRCRQYPAPEGAVPVWEKGPSDPNTSEQMGFVQCTPGILLRVTFVCLQNSRGSLSRTTFFEVDRTLSSHGFREPSSTFFDQLQRAASESASRFL